MRRPRESSAALLAAAACCVWPAQALAAKAAPDAGAPPVLGECQRLAARIEKRKRFLDLRLREHKLHPTDPTFSPYCADHPDDEECQLPGQTQEQQDLSRDVSALSWDDKGEPPATDPVIVPLERRRRELHCPDAR